jgi:phosphinothricin acetyltransferase
MNALRLAAETDAAEILKIYEPYVRETAVSFEYETPSLAEFTRRVSEISREYPYIVCETGGEIIGYAYAHRQMERAAYQWNAETSVYVGRARHRRGAGKILYGALIEILRLQNVRNLYAIVTSPNENSERFHEHFGFRKRCIFRNMGYKNGSWRDILWYEKSIGNFDAEPEPFTPIYKIAPDAILKILDKYSDAPNRRDRL